MLTKEFCNVKTEVLKGQSFYFETLQGVDL